MGNGKVNGQARQRDFGDAIAAVLKEQAGAEIYPRRHYQVAGVSGPSGFPRGARRGGAAAPG